MNRKLLLTAGVIGMIIFAGCQQTGPQKAPEDMVKDGMKKLAEVKSHDFEVSAIADLNGPKDKTPAKVKLNLVFGGAVDFSNPQDPKVNLHLDGGGNADAQNASGSAEFRMNKDAFFFTLSKLALKDDKGADLVPPMMVGYIGKWWKVAMPPELLKQITDAVPAAGSDDSTLTPQQKKMKDLFENTQFFKNIKFVAVEDVKGEQSYHYTAEVDKIALQNFIIASAEENAQPMTDDEKKSMMDGLAKVDFVGNIWVGKDSGVLNQVSGDIQLPTSDVDPSGTISLRMTLWNLNKPVTVTVPTDATEFPMEGILGGMMGGSPMGTDPMMMDGSTGTTSLPVPANKVKTK